MSKLFSCFLIYCLFSLLATPIASQDRFPCDGKRLVSSSDGRSTSIFDPFFIPFAPPLLSLYARYDGHFDALGFNPKDNFIYSIDQKSKAIVRLSRYGEVDSIGKVPIVDSINVAAGDCSAEGFYCIYENISKTIFVFEVVESFKMIKKVKLYWDPKLKLDEEFQLNLFDFAFDPNDPSTALSHYSFYGNINFKSKSLKGSMLTINLNLNDINFGMVAPLGKISQSNTSHITGLAFDANSGLYGIASTIDSVQIPKLKYISIDSKRGQSSDLIYHNTSLLDNDACSCPFSLTFTNSGPLPGMFCNNDSATFVISLFNNSFQPLNDLVLNDTFPEGTYIKSISSSFKGSIKPNTGVEKQILSISNLSVASKEKVDIIIVVYSINAKEGITPNQVYIENLPPRFPKYITSDDPNSSIFGDATYFIFETRGIQKLSWKTTSPSDCIKADDGKIVLTSSQFTPSQIYEVSLRNKNGWKEYIKVAKADAQNSITLDSIYPGDYQVFKFRTLSDNCGLALKEITILLDPPNDLLNLQLNSNSPVCEGEDLLLKSNSIDQSVITWRGPNVFGSEDKNPVIASSSKNASGIYEAQIEYGYCKLKKKIPVEIKSKFEIDLLGKKELCLKDSIKIIPLSKNNVEPLSYKWITPSGLYFQDSILALFVDSYEKSGTYSLISSNGACVDTASIEISILPTPKISMDQFIATDFCQKVVLKNEIESSVNVDFKWAPSEGLSCDDCQNPILLPIVKPSYGLKVINQFNCYDSTSIKIVLEKENLLITSNVFSFEVDSENNYFKMIGNCVVKKINEVKIFNRGGNNVFVFNGTDKDKRELIWNGFFNGQKVDKGVYVWLAKLELVDGSIVLTNGDITVL